MLSGLKYLQLEGELLQTHLPVCGIPRPRYLQYLHTADGNVSSVDIFIDFRFDESFSIKIV